MTYYYIDLSSFNVLKYGLFAVNKTKGVTSAKTLEVLKNVIANGNVKEDSVNSYCLRAGHGGTLDSSATGILVVGLLEGCKLLTRLLHGSKQYHVTGKLGIATDTYNDLGQQVLSAPFQHVTERKLHNALKKYRGSILQTPPKYSALKRSGVRLSDLARQGKEVDVKPREVTCHNIQLTEFSPPYFQLSIECGPGFYVRSLIHDIGKDVNSCAHVTDLVRTKHGPFHIEDSLPSHLWTKQNIIESVERYRSLVESRLQKSIKSV